ncbi:hypothetical protein [Sphingobium sp.]|uniref:hypothetical protein n=1 Tax=Sphingobium sp. TaxID=1912891 RepID=UPI0028BEBCF9|nr:hypothetical protein [Sphingobium sp.]
MNDLRDFLIWWALALIAGATVAVGQIAHKMARLDIEMPSDPAKLDAWHKRRKWLAITELSALPAFATLATAGRVYFDLPPIVGVLVTMGLGFIGFAMLIDGAKYLFRKRVGLSEEGGGA